MAGLLATVNCPDDLRKIPLERFPELAQEIRDEIIRVVTVNGGHMGGNLGVVELTLALHYVFDFPHDKLVWDVSHQAYVHKLITGRRDQFHTLRQYQGISGYCNKDESRFDTFTFAHAGTGLSTAMGLVSADDILQQSRHTVAVVGDGGLTCGVALEALNHCGALKKNLLVVLNDNAMSIATTVGALSNYLNKIRVAPLYHEAVTEVKGMLERIPVVGRPVEEFLHQVRMSIKKVMPGHLFEELGYHYYGPVDGHSMKALIDALKDVKYLKRPVLLHVITEKGRGYGPAKDDPCNCHGVSPAPKGKESKVEPPKAEAKPAKKAVAYTKAFSDALLAAARKDTRIVGLTAAMPDGTGLTVFGKEFPDRYFDVGICEQHAVAMAGGLATNGLRPVAAIYSSFLQRAYDMIFHEVCLQNVPVFFCCDRAGLVGDDGPTHHGMFDIAYFRTLPNVGLMAPRDGRELTMMLDFALTRNHPMQMRYPRTNIPDHDEVKAPAPIEYGKAEILSEGKDGFLVGYGATVYHCLAAAGLLAGEGLSVGVVNARFAKPVDTELFVRLADETPLLLTVEDHQRMGGFGSAVQEAVADAGGRVERIAVLGVGDHFVEHGHRDILLGLVDLHPEGIARRFREALAVRSRRAPAAASHSNPILT